MCCQEICSDGMASALGPSLCVPQWYFPLSHHHCNAAEEPRAATECFLRKLHNPLCSSLGRFAHPVWCLAQLSDQSPVPLRRGNQPWSPSLSAQGFGVKIPSFLQCEVLTWFQGCSGCRADPLGHQVCPLFSWTLSTLMAVCSCPASSCPSSLKAEHPSLQDEDVAG